MTGYVAALAAETGIPPSVLACEEAFWLDAMFAHLEKKARAASGADEDVDWDETFGSDDN